MNVDPRHGYAILSQLSVSSSSVLRVSSYLDPTDTRLHSQLFYGPLCDDKVAAGVVVGHDGDN